MRHQVVWSAEAYRSLQRIWDEAFDREKIADAIDEIHEALAEHADERGESRPNGSRIFFASPLGIAFWANERATEVEIRAVWIFQRV